MAILTRSGRAALAKTLKATPSYLGLGSGNGSWTTTWPAEDASANTLMAEFGRRKASGIDYVVQDDNGEIEIPGAGNFSVSSTPTRQLVYTFKLAFADAPTAVIRELGIFINVTVNPALPAGQMWFTPSQIVQSGDLLQLEHRAPIARTPASREIFSLLITL
jgi:hypothetical protein